MLICRTEVPLSQSIRDKIALFCDLAPSEVVENIDVESIYEIPLVLEEQGLAQLVIDKLNLKCGELDLTQWKNMVERIKNLKEKVTVALVGKYVELRMPIFLCQRP